MTTLRASIFLLALLAFGAPPNAHGQTTSAADLLSGIVQVKTYINPDARTGDNLGHRRDGTGVVLDNNGLILTIGYLMVEAHAAEVVTQDGRAVPANIVGYDHESGFGLLRAMSPIKVRPLPIGSSADVKEKDGAIVASYGGTEAVGAVTVVSRREFAGSWEYLLDNAIFTAPARRAWSGAGLINSKGELIGIGSLIVGDAAGDGSGKSGNMFVPIGRLQPVLGDLMANGRPGMPPIPWLGITTEDVRGTLVVARAVPGGPAEKAGLKRGDIIAAVDGQRPRSLGDFYRKVRALGSAGVTVPLEIEQGSERRRVDIKSMDRLDHLKLNSTF